MPELPEVETVMRGLLRLTGHIIVAAEVHRPNMRWPFPAGLAATLTGARVEGFRRRAKYILMRLSTGDSALLHLGMSGRLVIGPDTGAPPGLHEHVVLHIDDGCRVALCDPRRFGSVDLVPTAAEDAHRLLANLGPEPLDAAFDAKHLVTALRGRRTPIKAALLDQRIVAGLGNIYVNEALFRARVNPHRLAGTLSAARVKILVATIKVTLADAIAAGGSSLRDYVQPSGELGYFQHAWRVYGHAGEPCERCQGPPCPGIQRTVQSGRGTFHCPLTQR